VSSVPHRCIIDASAIIPAFLADPRSLHSQRLIQALKDPNPPIFYVPSIFFAEVASGFWKAHRFAGIPRFDVEEGYRLLLRLQFQVLDIQGLAEDAFAAALDHGVSAYDSYYFLAARRFGLPLITADTKLQKLIQNQVSVLALTDIT